MALIVKLKQTEPPATTEGWALIAPAARGGFEGRGALACQLRGITHFIPATDPETDLEQAVVRAVRWADHHGVPTVYVCEAG